MAASPNVTPRPPISAPSGHPGSSEKAHGSSASSPTIPTTPSLGLPKVLKPIGIINEQNTCFLNSTFQALSATTPLISLLTNSPTSSLHPGNTSALPKPIISPTRIPSLQPEALEPPLYPLLPVTRAFISCLHTAWKKKDAGGGTSGTGESNSARYMSLRSLLREIARKYDQYDDYRQQDSHELLRHLLDSMEMEEKDVIKKLQPTVAAAGQAGGKKKNKGGLAGISPMVSPLPSPAHSAPTSPMRQTSLDPLEKAVGADTSKGDAGLPREIPENERLIPFVDVLFGGMLASVVVCEKCKSVSHTYEGFLDISLSLKADEPRTRKRDKIKALFRPRGSHKASTETVHSDGEFSEGEITPIKERERRKSMDPDEGSSLESQGLARRGSLKTFGLKSKTSFSFGKKKTTTPTGSRPGSSSAASNNSLETDRTTLPHANSATSVISGGASPNGSYRTQGSAHHHHLSGPTPAQSAYIQRILHSGHSTPIELDPLAKLRAANSGEGTNVNKALPVPEEWGLVDSLRAFTSVEVLEGDNAFACKKCWKIKSGKYTDTHPPLREADEDNMHSPPTSPDISARLTRSPVPIPPSISIRSDSSGPILPGDDNSQAQVQRNDSLRSTDSDNSQARLRAPSPLRKQIGLNQSAELVPTDTISSIDSQSTIFPTGSDELDLSADNIDGDNDDDGLSDSSTSEDQEQPSPLVVARPRMPPRRKSTHFVMRRAFKRYLIAKAPEVLVFHFKRFKQTQKTSIAFTSFYDLKKMDDFVAYPEILDLAPFLAPNRNDYKITQTITGPRAPYMDWPSPEHGPESDPVLYRLYGTMIGGHYVAYVLVDPERMFEQGQEVLEAIKSMDLNSGEGTLPSPENGREKIDKRVWCFCSDTSIRLASVDEVLKARAYLCFYERIQS